jgi:hypothetical protein
MKRRCAAITKKGKPCCLAAKPDSDFCRWHDPRPASVKARLDASSRGGKGRSAPATNSDIQFDLTDIHKIPWVHTVVVEQVRCGKLDIKRAQFIRQSADSALKALQIGPMQTQMNKILQQLETEKNKPVNQAVIDDLLRFAPDDMPEIEDAGHQDDAHDAAARVGRKDGDTPEGEGRDHGKPKG